MIINYEYRCAPLPRSSSGRSIVSAPLSLSLSLRSAITPTSSDHNLIESSLKVIGGQLANAKSSLHNSGGAR